MDSESQHSDTDFVLAQRKRKNTTSFACYVRNITPQALGISVPLGIVENMPTMEARDRLRLTEASRLGYSVPLADVPEPLPPPSRPKPQPAGANSERSGRSGHDRGSGWYFSAKLSAAIEAIGRPLQAQTVTQ